MPTSNVHSILAEAARRQRAGDLSGAWDMYHQVLRLVPGQFDALHLLGVIARERGEPKRAVDLITRAHASRAPTADSRCNLAGAFVALEQLDRAAEEFGAALALEPDHPEAHDGLARVLARLNRLDAALGHARRAAQLGACAETLGTLGAVHCRRGELPESIAAFARGLRIDANHAALHNGMGQALQLARDWAGAGRHYRKAIELNPNYAAAWSNLGALLAERRQTREALKVLSRALRLQPNSAETLCALGVAVRETDQPDEAARWLEKAIAVDPTMGEAWNNLAITRLDQGRVADAVACCRSALGANPNCIKAHDSLLFAMIFLPGDDGIMLADEQRRWGIRHANALTAAAAAHGNDRDPDRRLRIGYVSPNFREHCQALFLAPLLSAHDRRQHEIFCYSDVALPDAITNRLAAHADVWRDTRLLSDAELAALVRNDRVDILVDLTMHLAGNRELAFARKPAPVQVCWLAYPGSTGMAAMDYRVSDDLLDPPGMNDPLYIETTVRLPAAFWCYDPLDERTSVAPLPCSGGAGITFGCLNNYCKVNGDVLRLWGAVLKAVPGSRMVILSSPGRHRLDALAALGAAGVGPDRITFEPRRPRAQYLELYHRIDIALDTFPSNGHTTSLDALWMGVPVVTRVGRTVTGRAGLCQLTLLGMQELIARDDAGYVAAAAALAGDVGRLAELRRTLRDRLRRSPLMDAAGFARGMESAMRRMWRRWCDREPDNNGADGPIADGERLPPERKQA